MNTTEAHAALATLVLRSTHHLDGPVLAVQLGTDDGDISLAWDVENARIMHGEGIEAIVDLYQVSDPRTDSVFGQVRQPRNPCDTLSLDLFRPPRLAVS
jgi:hypothetical protein